jgi:hypothetical protein
VSEYDDRRKYQRVTLVRPLDARIGPARVFILGASVTGVLIAHQGNIPTEGSVCVIRFEWESIPVVLGCRITRNKLHKLAKNAQEKSVFQAGLEIVSATEEAAKTHREMIISLVSRALDEQKANAHGIPAVVPLTFQTGKGSNYLRLELVKGAWRRAETTRPDQPINGFTISAEESRAHVDLLCEAYLSSDPEGRKMIQTMAQLSISKAEGIPTRRFNP